MAAANVPVLTVEQMDDWWLLRSDGNIVGTILLRPGWEVRTAHATQTLQHLFVVRQLPDIEIVREVVRRPHQLMPNPGVFNRNGDLVGQAGPAPYPNHVQPQDFERN